MDSKLQIISGIYRGRKLRLPPNARPTQNRARIALFNMIESGIVNFDSLQNVWDAFGGSGAFGIECLSRYSGVDVVFTDIAPTSIKTMRDNLSTLGVGARARVIQTDAISAAQKYAPTSDLIFIDAPYSMHELGAALVKKIGALAKSGTIVIWEQESINPHQPDESKWQILRDKTYGRARFLILQKI